MKKVRFREAWVGCWLSRQLVFDAKLRLSCFKKLNIGDSLVRKKGVEYENLSNRVSLRAFGASVEQRSRISNIC